MLKLEKSPMIHVLLYRQAKKTTIDGSTIVTHNDDSSIADFRLWIIPEADWPENARRDIVIYSHD